MKVVNVTVRSTLSGVDDHLQTTFAVVLPLLVEMSRTGVVGVMTDGDVAWHRASP